MKYKKQKKTKGYLQKKATEGIFLCRDRRIITARSICNLLYANEKLRSSYVLTLRARSRSMYVFIVIITAARKIFLKCYFQLFLATIRVEYFAFERSFSFFNLRCISLDFRSRCKLSG